MATSGIAPEMIETLITGDLEHGAIIPRRPEFAGPPFRDLAHAEEVWRANRELILRIHRRGWQDVDGEATLYVRNSPWLRDRAACWAEVEFDGAGHVATEFDTGNTANAVLIPGRRARS